MSNVSQILIVDDHPVFRSGLRSFIDSELKMHVVGDVSNGEAALEFLKDHSIDVVILDLDMPKMNGLEFAQTVVKQKIPVEIIILTMHKEEELFSRAMALGIKGFVSKENAITEISEAIRTVIEGRYYVCSMFSHYLISRSGPPTPLSDKVTGLELLTTAERKVIKLIAANKSTKQIAEELFISPKTVENHRTNICIKLGLHGSHALLRFLIENRSLL
jgi:DNA-binding NarL/FixJ family response regulator